MWVRETRMLQYGGVIWIGNDVRNMLEMKKQGNVLLLVQTF